jgi:hypothetical protein
MQNIPALTSAPGAEKRRSQRLLLSVTLLVRGQNKNNQPFEEETHTLVVNAHGGLLVLGMPVNNGSRLTLVNRGSEQEVECKVVFLGPTHGGKTQVGFEFAQPTPNFWHVSFPPPDWNPEG